MKVAIIPARGGSKRIPGKNIKPFCGKPMIAHSILAAQDSGLFDRIIISTDDAQIAAVAKDYGAEVPFVRPPELASDHAATAPVVAHAIRWLASEGHMPDHVCCIYATAPFLHAHYLRAGFEALVSSGKSFAFSVTTFPYPIQRALRLTAEGAVDMFSPEFFNSRSQDLEPAYHDAGQFYWGRPGAFLEERIAFSPMSVPVILPRKLTQDIDTPEDWDLAELLYRAWKANGSAIPDA